MTHPDALLAGYVDGTLSDRERAVVDEHLATCAVCHEELELASEARKALWALEDRPVPFGVTGPVLAEAGRRTERRHAVWERVQWAAGLAAAAAIVAVVALNLSGGSPDPAAPMAAGGADAPASTGAVEMADAARPRLERQREVSYDDAGVRSLAAGASSRTQGAADDGGGGEAVAAEAQASLRFASAPERDDAVACLRRSGAPLDEPRDRLIRLIEAQYEGVPAYLGVFLESPGGGQPPDSAIVWVAAVRDCRILTIASQTA